MREFSNRCLRSLTPLFVTTFSIAFGAFRNADFVVAQKESDLFQEKLHSLPVVGIYDNVLSKANAEWLHKLCSEWNDSTQNHKEDDINPNPKDVLFEFPLKHPEKHSPIQQFLNDLVWETIQRENGENNTPDTPRYYVEYWTRQQWHHILAHQDMDEGWERRLRKGRQECFERNSQASLKDDAHLYRFEDCEKDARNFRHPIMGQVLYLQVGSKVTGPTIVFDAANGGDLMTMKPKSNETDTNGRKSMVSVPAVEGRLLRFVGDRLHAVPRPHDVYWTFDQSQNNIHTLDYERSVLLFNLWNHSENEFLVDKLLDCGDGSFPRDRTTCYKSDHSNKIKKPQKAQSNKCNVQSKWKNVPIVHRPSAPRESDQLTKENEESFLSLLWNIFFSGFSVTKESFQVPLSGDDHKRGISGYVARMVSSSWWEDDKHAHPARDNLGEAHVPTWTEIEIDERFAVIQGGERSEL